MIHDLTLKGPWSVVLKIFSEIKHVLKEDAGLELAVSKTQILSKEMSLDKFKERAAHIIHSDESLELLRPLLDSEDDHEIFTVEGFKGLGVHTGTPAFITRLIEEKVHEYAKDIDKLDILQDGKVHFDLIKFCHCVSKYGCLLADDSVTVPANAAPAARATQMSSDDVSLQPTIYPPQLNHLCKVHKPVNLIGLE